MNWIIKNDFKFSLKNKKNIHRVSDTFIENWKLKACELLSRKNEMPQA